MTWGSNPGGWYTCATCKRRVFDGREGDVEAHRVERRKAALSQGSIWGRLWRFIRER